MSKIKGLICAPFTAFDAHGLVNLERVPLQAKFYKDNGVRGVFACGTTGEGTSLSMVEKKALFKEWSKQRSESFAVIGFLGGTSVADCRELAVYAKEVGLDAVAMTAPYYQRPASVKDLALTVAEVASSVPDMPFYFYHIPVLTKVYFPMIRFLEIVDELVPNFAGIKYTDENMMDFHQCLEFKNRKYNIMWGRDEMMLEALSIGCRTFVGSTYGYMAPLYLAIEKAFDNQDMIKASCLQFEAVNLITLLDKYGSGTGKAFMKAAGLDLGPCRRPLNTLEGEKFNDFIRDLSYTKFEFWKNSMK